MKKILKFLLIVFIYTTIYILSNIALPFSQAFKNSSANADPNTLSYVILCSIWVCFTICFIVSRSKWYGIKLLIAVIGIIFFVQSVLSQIETLFFNSAFTMLSKRDIFMIMLAGALPLIVAVPFADRLFSDKSGDNSSSNFVVNIKKLIFSVVALGFVYVLIYFTFGYFVAWQLEDLRIFYTGTPEDLGFLGQQVFNWETNIMIYPLQFVRGILFVVSTLPLLYMMQRNKIDLIISISLVYLCTAIMLIIPNFLFQDAVRWMHFLEMISSMALFGLITGFVLSRCRK